MAIPVVPTKRATGVDGLSARETAVLELIARGETNAEAADKLGISPLTVKKHLERMYAATGTRNRAELIALAYARSGGAAAPWRVRPRHNLPSALTRFVGREREVAEVTSLLAGTRLVTLGGPGGVGKSRLALEVAAAVLDRYPDGVWLVELASLSDARLVPQAVSVALGLRDGGGSRAAALAAHLRSKTLLLVLDNCEHLVHACADLVAPLLRDCAGLTVLATSRERLGVAGEAFWPVPALSLADDAPRSGRAIVAAAERSEAVRLFVERASLRVPRFALSAENASALAQICRRLDGLPLAIELAAARMNVLSVNEIAARLDDRFRELRTAEPDALPRHRTLGGAIDWSHQLLGRAEAKLFARLAVFAGGCTFDAAREICGGGGVEEAEILELLARLVDRSFVIADTRRSETRYRTLETLREYASERLDRDGDASAIRRRHAEHYLRLAERAEPELRGPDQLRWYERLEVDHDNFRAALRWSLEHDPEMAQRLGGALWRFWFHRGHGAEGLGWLEQALATAAPTSSVARGKALNGAGNLADFGGDAARSEALHRENLSLQRETGGENWLLTAALSNYADRLRERGAHAEARPLYLEALGLRGMDRWGLALTTSQLGHIALDEGDVAEAGRLYAEALRLWRSVRDRDRMAWAMGFVARVERQRGRHQRATSLLRRSLVVFRAFGDRIAMTRALEERAVVAAATGDLGRAVRLLATSFSSREELGAPAARGELVDLPWLTPLRERLRQGQFADEWAAGAATRLEVAVDREIARE